MLAEFKNKSPGIRFSFPSKTGDVYFKFNLKNPINSQIDYAKDILKAERKSYQEKQNARTVVLSMVLIPYSA